MKCRSVLCLIAVIFITASVEEAFAKGRGKGGGKGGGSARARSGGGGQSFSGNRSRMSTAFNRGSKYTPQASNGGNHFKKNLQARTQGGFNARNSMPKTAIPSTGKQPLSGKLPSKFSPQKLGGLKSVGSTQGSPASGAKQPLSQLKNKLGTSTKSQSSFGAQFKSKFAGTKFVPNFKAAVKQHHDKHVVANHVNKFCQPHHPNYHRHINWCHSRPRACWWWSGYCHRLVWHRPIRHCYYDWRYVRCHYVVNDRVIVHNVRWYLGIKGMVLPGSGFGVEEVAANSPAALAGIQPGHVILRVNGVDLVDQQSFDDVMAQTNGVLQMTILDDQQQQHEIVVRMQRLATVSY